jgi:hypothetical protein
MLAELESITMQELAEDALRIEAIKESGKLKRRVLVGAEVY